MSRQHRRRARVGPLICAVALLCADVASASGWTELQKLVAADAAGGDSFGIAVDSSGDRLIVASIYADVSGHNHQGAAYVFLRVGPVWQQEAKLFAADGAANDEFSTGVALDGSTAVVGAPRANGVGNDSGAVYVYVRSGTSWSLQQKLVALDSQPGDAFGRAVALEGDTLVVGADGDDEGGVDSGSAYVFTRSGTTWTQTAKLVPPDGQTNDSAGRSVQISGDTVVFGAHADDDVAQNAGSAYVYVRSGASWALQAKLLAPDGAAADNFGRSVGIDQDTVVVTSWLDDDGAVDAGSAYVWQRTGGTWALQQKIVPDDASPDENFGKPVALGRDVLVVGGVRDDDLGFDSGSVYVYRRSGSNWTREQKLLASDGEADALFGASVAVDGNRLVVGSAKDDAPANDSGSAYVFELAQTWSASCFGDGSGSACPCGNVGDTVSGCANSASSAGAGLTAEGRASIGTDTLQLRAVGLPNGPSLFFQGTALVSGGAGVAFGDGLRCVAGTVVRLGVVIGADHAASYPSGAVPPNDVPIALRGAVTAGVRHYQVWYRDADPAFCAASTFNLTNAVSVTWGP